MVHIIQYVVAFFSVSTAFGFHLQSELSPLADANTDSIIIRSEIAKGELTKVREVAVLRRDRNGMPLELNEHWYIECTKCKKKKESCSCSTTTLPSVIASPTLLRKTMRDVFSDPAVSLNNEGTALLSPGTSTVEGPNRVMQALAACISFPQLLCIGCSSTEDEPEINACYDEYVSPFALTEDYRENNCCHCLFTFCPCCMPQEEI